MSAFNTVDVKNAILDCVLDRYNSIPAENEIEYTFSQKFERWAQKLIQKTHDKQFKTNARFGGRTLKLAIIVAALIAMLAVTAMAVPAIREAILDFFLSDRGESYGITFDPEQAASAPENIQDFRIPQFIPEGFVNVVDEKSVALVTIAWMNDKDELICYNQAFIPDDATSDSWVGISSEGATRSTMIINGYKVEIIQDEMVYTAVWTDNAYIYFLEMPNSLDLAVFEQIMSSIDTVSQPTT